MNRIFQVVLATFVFLKVSNTQGQYAVDQLDLDGDLHAWYDGAIGDEHSAVLEGSYYALKNLALKDGPYFIDRRWGQGSLTFAGQSYDSASLLYHVSEDVLIVRNQAVSNAFLEPILPNQQKIDGFDIHGHQFVRLEGNEAPARSSGFYEIFFEGDSITFYIKRIKNEYVRGKTLEFVDEDRYYIFDGSDFTRYTGKRTMFKKYPQIKSEMKTYGRTLDVNLRNGEEKGMLKWLAYCDQLLSEK